MLSFPSVACGLYFGILLFLQSNFSLFVDSISIDLSVTGASVAAPHNSIVCDGNVVDRKLSSDDEVRTNNNRRKKNIRLWCFSPKPGASEKKKYFFPCRCLSSIGHDDLIILPGNHEPTKEFASLVTKILGKSTEQVIWTAGTSAAMDDDINDDVISSTVERISSVIGKEDNSAVLTIMPYRATKHFLRWFKDLRKVLERRFAGRIEVKVFGESQDWMHRFGTKGLLHRHIADLSVPSEIENIDASITVARGFQCSTSEHLLKAYDLLGGGEVVIKPMAGSAGEGIIFTDSRDDLQKYDFPMGDVVLEERLEIDCAPDGMIISPAVHYFGNTILGRGLVDQLIENCSYLGWRQSVVNPEFEATVLKHSKKIIDATDPQGPGGFDFLSVNGVPVLSDINTGRFNGAHQPKIFLEQYAAPDCCWYCWKHVPPSSLKADMIWEALRSEHIAYDPLSSSASSGGEGAEEGEGEGVFPLTHLRGLEGMYISIAKTNERALELYHKAREVFMKLSANANGRTEEL